MGFYAVNQMGQLVCRVDWEQDGTTVIDNVVIVGQEGWGQMRHLFADLNRVIYAVDQQGQLLFYRDTLPTARIDIANRGVIGLGGWQQFKFLFSGGDGIIYAVVA